jgi:hypothetical protein
VRLVAQGPRFVSLRCQSAVALPRVQPSTTLNALESTMNTDIIAPRLFSLAMAALITATTLAGIDTLAHTEHAANGVMAQTSAGAAHPA